MLRFSNQSVRSRVHCLFQDMDPPFSCHVSGLVKASFLFQFFFPAMLLLKASYSFTLASSFLPFLPVLPLLFIPSTLLSVHVSVFVFHPLNCWNRSFRATVSLLLSLHPYIIHCLLLPSWPYSFGSTFYPFYSAFSCVSAFVFPPIHSAIGSGPLEPRFAYSSPGCPIPPIGHSTSLFLHLYSGRKWPFKGPVSFPFFLLWLVHLGLLHQLSFSLYVYPLFHFWFILLSPKWKQYGPLKRQ
jgi:hypothetical protein